MAWRVGLTLQQLGRPPCRAELGRHRRSPTGDWERVLKKLWHSLPMAALLTLCVLASWSEAHYFTPSLQAAYISWIQQVVAENRKAKTLFPHKTL